MWYVGIGLFHYLRKQFRMEMFFVDEFSLPRSEKFRCVRGSQGMPALYVLAPPADRVPHGPKFLAGLQHVYRHTRRYRRIVSEREAERFYKRLQYHAGYLRQRIQAHDPRR